MLKRICICLFLSVLPSYLGAVTATSPLASESGEALSVRVRIPLKMSPYTSVVTKNSRGQTRTTYKKVNEMNHTLRAKLDSANHFYFAGWHVQSTPLQWQRDIKKYTVKLDFYRLYGDGGALEEKLGSITTSGFLIGGENHVFTLAANASMTFKTTSGEPILDLSVGQNPLKDQANLSVAKQIEK